MVKERLLEYIEEKGVTKSYFEKSLKMGNGYINNVKSIGSDKLEDIITNYPDLNIVWLITGNGNMLTIDPSETGETQTLPRIPYTAAAGTLGAIALDGITDEHCERVSVVKSFPRYNFTIVINGDSMEPEYRAGDEVACLALKDSKFVQWGKVHVLDTSQGIIIKKIFDAGESIRCSSTNPMYPDFVIPKDEIYSLNLVVGLLRL